MRMKKKAMSVALPAVRRTARSIDDQEKEKLEVLPSTFIIALLNYPTKRDEYTSILASSMAVLGIDYQCRCIIALTYTPKLTCRVCKRLRSIEIIWTG